jgi:hypothetical protein
VFYSLKTQTLEQHHVSLVVWVVVIIVVCKMYGVRGVRPPDLRNAQTLIQTPITNRATARTLLYICFVLYLNPFVGTVGATTGPGLAQPLVVRFVYICDHEYTHWRALVCNMVQRL